MEVLFAPCSLVIFLGLPSVDHCSGIFSARSLLPKASPGSSVWRASGYQKKLPSLVIFFIKILTPSQREVCQVHLSWFFFFFSAAWPGEPSQISCQKGKKWHQQSGVVGPKSSTLPVACLDLCGGLRHKNFLTDVFKATWGEKVIEGLKEAEDKWR